MFKYFHWTIIYYSLFIDEQNVDQNKMENNAIIEWLSVSSRPIQHIHTRTSHTHTQQQSLSVSSFQRCLNNELLSFGVTTSLWSTYKYVGEKSASSCLNEIHSNGFSTNIVLALRCIFLNFPVIWYIASADDSFLYVLRTTVSCRWID